MPAGRPSKYKPDYCEQVIKLGKEGKSEVQISASIDIPRTTMRRWADDHEEFRSALTRAKELAQAWWEDKAVSNLNEPTFQTALWKKSVEARFRDDYTERREVTGKDGEPLSPPSSDDREVAKALLGILASAVTPTNGSEDEG